MKTKKKNTKQKKARLPNGSLRCKQSHQIAGYRSADGSAPSSYEDEGCQAWLHEPRVVGQFSIDAGAACDDLIRSTIDATDGMHAASAAFAFRFVWTTRAADCIASDSSVFVFAPHACTCVASAGTDSRSEPGCAASSSQRSAFGK